MIAQRDLQNIPIPDPELERATFRVPEGFEVNLFAADPAIAKPIQMNFDVDGRLWLVSSEVYPQIRPGQVANDRVLVLEDTDADGVADATHVFADGLLIPTGIAPGDGGAWVANSTQLLHFADTDGDLRADERRIVLSGFGTEDTHHILHTLRWGLDGSLYFNQSIYIHSHVETPWGVRRLDAGGIWQFRPETRQLGVFMRGLVNSWGHDFDRFGQSFATDGAGGEGINYVIPGGYYFTAANADRILHGLNPGSPKHCGLEIVETPALPPDWQGSALTNDFRGHRVCRFTLSDESAGYISREQEEVIWSDHVAFRPVDVKQGPDGAIYIADWYNPIIQHGEVDFRDDRRDHTHGRIWRIRWTGSSPTPVRRMSELPNAELFEALRSADRFQRRAAKRVLRERGAGVVPELLQWLHNTPADDHLKLEVLWTLQSTRATDPGLLDELLQSEDPRVRAAAVRVLSDWKYQFPSRAAALAAAVTDPHPRVRLEAVRGLSFSALQQSERDAAVQSGRLDETAMQRLESAERVESALEALDLPRDRFLDYALWLTTRELSDRWLPAFQEGAIDFGGNIDRIVFAFRAVGGDAPVELLMDRVYAQGVSPAERRQLTELIGSSADVPQLTALFERAAEQQDAATLNQIVAAADNRNLTIAPDANQLRSLLSADEPSVRAVAMAAIGRWKNETLIPQLTNIARQPDRPIGDRVSAVRGVVASGVADAIEQVVRSAASDDAPAELQTALLVELAAARPQRAAQLLPRVLPRLPVDGPFVAAVTRAFLARNEGDALLMQSLPETPLSSDTGREMLRALRESGRAVPELQAAVRAAADIRSRKTLNAEERAALLTMAMQHSDPAEGERVFRDEQFGCLRCHAVGGAGGQVGPDMVSLGGSAQPDYLLESLLTPNAKVKENYHTIIIATTDGRILSGVRRGESQDAVTIRTAEDREIRVPRQQIEEVVPGVSLMPEGLVDPLTDRELAALVRFLSELGRTPEYSLSKRRLARTWDVMLPTEQAAYHLRRTSYASAAADHPAFTWQRAISRVDGSLPLADIPTVTVRNRSAAGARGVGFARTQLTVTTAGAIRLRVNSTTGLELRIDDAPVDIAATMTVPLSVGTHRLTLTVDHAERDEPVELELTDAPGDDAGHAAFVN